MRGMKHPEPVAKKYSADSKIKEPKVNLKETFAYLVPYLWDFKGRVILAMIALVGAKAATLIMPWALKRIIDGVDPSIHPELYLPLVFLIFYGLLRFGSV